MAIIGYARVSTDDQNPALQIDALKRSGCTRIFEEVASGARKDRPQLHDTLQYMVRGDTLVVWKLDRLARSLNHLIETIEYLHGQGCGFRSVTESIDTTTAGGRLAQIRAFALLRRYEKSRRMIDNGDALFLYNDAIGVLD